LPKRESKQTEPLQELRPQRKRRSPMLNVKKSEPSLKLLN